ncbi:MAG: ABC transporter substrate-binding protein [Granulosicoccus sp.]
MLSGCKVGLLLSGLAALLIQVASNSAAMAAKPKSDVELPTVVSINLCADQLVMLLADDKQILSLSRLSHEPGGSIFHEKARLFPVNSGAAEAVIELAPDFVLVGPYTSRYTTAMLRELGVQVEVLPIAGSMEAMLENVTTIAALLNKHDAGERIVDGIKRRLADIKKQSGDTPKHSLTALVYDANGYTSGEETIRGHLLELAGWSNAASTAGISGYGTLSLETLIRLSPDALIHSPYNKNGYSRAQSLTQHPAIRASGFNPLVIPIAANKTICAGPWSMDVVEQLIAELEELAIDSTQEKPINRR